jgi:prevent-host-death family protein
MKTVEVSEAKNPLGQSVRELGSEPLVVTDEGVPIAALVPIEEMDLESLALGSNPKFLAILERARAEYRQGAGLSTEAVRRELGLL